MEGMEETHFSSLPGSSRSPISHEKKALATPFSLTILGFCSKPQKTSAQNGCRTFSEEVSSHFLKYAKTKSKVS